MSPLLKRTPSEETKKLRIYCLASALLALVIMLFVYLVHSNSLLFGKSTVLRMDLYHQYGPLYSELYDRIVNGYSLTYSWTSGAGGGFMGNLFNYCCSPFAIFMLICGHKNMPEAIALMMLFKGVLASTSFTYYLNKSKKRVDLFSVPFGLLYAYCGFFVAYSWNIMWLDAMAVFPLVILGIERIIDNRKPTLFICMLTYTMITNYYMAYMVTLLSVLYFLYYYFCRYSISDKLCKKTVQPAQPEPDPEQIWTQPINPEQDSIISDEPVTTEAQTEEPADAVVTSIPVPEVKTKSKKAKKTKKKKRDLKNNRFWASGWTFAASGFLAFCLSAFALIPVAYCLQTSSATSASAPDDFKLYFNIFDFIANHLASVEPTIRSSGDVVLPNIYSGILAVILLPLYFLSNNISARKKIAATVFLGCFFFGFNVNMFNFIWHGFHFPNDLPFRFSFAYSFFILTLAYEVMLNLGEYSKKTFTGVGMGVLAFIVVTEKVESANVTKGTILLSALFVVIYTVVMGALVTKRFELNTLKKYLVFVVVLELLFCNTANYVMSQPRSNYTSDYDSYQEISDLTESNETELFYRTELSKLRARMDPCWYGYNGVSTFSSMAYEKTANVMYSMGLFSNKINSYTYYPQTPVFNSIFSLKYIYDNNSYLKNSDYYKKIAQNDTFTSYEYQYWLPIAFSVNDDMAVFDDGSSNPFTYQNAFMKAATGIDEILVPVQATAVTDVNFSSLSLSDVNTGSTFAIKKATADNSATAIITTTAETDGYYYVYAGGTKLSELKIKNGDISFDYVSSSIQPLTFDVGYVKAGESFEVELIVGEKNNSGNITYCASRLDMDKFQKAYNTIQKNGTIELTEFNEDNFTGTITVTNDNAFLFTSIPYDESWAIYVDGNKLEYFVEPVAEEDEQTPPVATKEEKAGKIVAVDGGFIGFNLSKGEHTVVMRYQPRGLSTGIKLTVFGLLVVALLLFFKYYLSEKLAAKGKRVTLFNVADEESAELQTEETISEKADDATTPSQEFEQIDEFIPPEDFSVEPDGDASLPVTEECNEPEKTSEPAKEVNTEEE